LTNSYQSFLFPIISLQALSVGFSISISHTIWPHITHFELLSSGVGHR
jgi:hypothetical protein